MGLGTLVWTQSKTTNAITKTAVMQAECGPAVCYSSMMPTRTQIIVCWLAFTGVMALLSILLQAFVPG